LFLASTAVLLTGILGFTDAASAKIVMPTVQKEAQKQAAAKARYNGGINPPAPPCPENGVLYPPPIPVPAGVPYLLGNCGVAQPVATSTPWMGNMAYYGGHVQVHPKEYIVYWGWGEPGAFGSTSCTPETFTEGLTTTTLGCDPDRAGKYMADFVHQMGGTNWANTQTQYYQADASGNKNAAALATTNSSNPAGSGNTYTMLAREASRAAAHFGVTGAALSDANFIIVQPPAYSDPNALNAGYCAFHDYTEPAVPGNFYYQDAQVQKDISWTNMPYVLAPSLQSGCGMNAVNSGDAGKLDGFSIVLGHEIEETITDPGAEATVGSGASVVQSGGWYDTTDPNENGDKCAWVGENLLTLTGPPLPVPGALGDITGNDGHTQFAVQSLWSNAENQGTGYCAGANTDSPVPAAAYGTGANAPKNSSPPTISGSATEGQTLTESQGSWTASPTSYSYQWADCDSSGQNCSPIQGATAQTYTLTAGDVGSTIVVEETASNASGNSAPALSSPTPVVTAASSSSAAPGPGGPTGSSGSTGAVPGTSGLAGAQGASQPSVKHATTPAKRHRSARVKHTVKRHRRASRIKHLAPKKRARRR
jgi:hypothetical protein